MISNLFLDQIPILNINNNELIPFFKDLYGTLKEKRTQAQIITFNLDFLRQTNINTIFQQLCKNNEFNFADGSGITRLISKKDKINIPRITGTEIFVALMDVANQLSLKVALIGCTEKVLHKVQNRLIIKFPNAKFELLLISPEYGFETNPLLNHEIINQLVNYKPDIVFLALGCPRQEFWLHKYKTQIDCKISVGIGAVFDFYSGEIKRAPKYIQRLGYEWLWRLLLEPRRLYKRYILYNIPTYIKYYLKYSFSDKPQQ